MKYIKVKNFRHAWLLLYFPLFITWFFLDEKFIVGSYVSMHIWIDKLIPFCEYFVIPYVLWYPLLGGVAIYLLIRDEHDFCRYMWSIIIGISFCLLFYIILPNGQDLRPQQFAHHNFFTGLVSLIYAHDTKLNVFPSIHVVGSIAPTVAILKNREAGNKAWVRIFITTLCVLICVSTLFIKQHSVLDFVSGALLYLPIYAMIFGRGRNLKLWLWPAEPLRKGRRENSGEVKSTQVQTMNR